MSLVIDRVHLPFPDRRSAGRLLAQRLGRAGVTAGTVVLGIPRGGVPVAAEVSGRLGLPLDVLVAHKVSPPWRRELAVGAVAADGTRVIDAHGRTWLGSEDALRDEVTAELGRAVERQAYLRAGGPPLDLAGHDVVVVDDGMAVGATMEAAVRAARRAGAGHITVAVPVASREAVLRLDEVADSVMALATPEPFVAVGEWYFEFGQISDGEVRRLLLKSRGRPLARTA